MISGRVYTQNCLSEEGKRLDHDVVILRMLPLSTALVVRLPSLSVFVVDFFFFFFGGVTSDDEFMLLVAQ